MSKRLTELEKAEVITDFTAGKTKTEIAKKFSVSITAISKILGNTKSLEKVKKSSKSSKELRREIINKATNSLYAKDFNELPPEVLLKIIERLSLLEPEEKGKEANVPTVVFEFRDVSAKANGKQEDNSSGDI